MFPPKVFKKYKIDEIKNEEKNKLNLIEKKPACTHKLLKCVATKIVSNENVFYDYDQDEEKIIRFVPITELKEIPWLDLREEAERAFLKYNLNWYKRVVSTREVWRIEHKDINPFVLDIIKHIETTGSDIEYIFRQDNKDKDIPQHVLALDMFLGIDLPDFSEKKAATVFKRYILNNLNGIIPLPCARLSSKKPLSISRGCWNTSRGLFQELK
ncbi:hypothetical protein NBO_1436g0003 [Nosema bombycis CQ1]|uniref:Uncharacterized protein n=1 Tax=Nosema bombycis (strain CQ1 / CVCC 102059) TaxID=578461 RepID=R0MEK4_NOSB1|nr:hypothetical protein NBO_1436g0003 [Nosema bombycis CQ1]|eukprot:EOB11213.1 hypothetical protein NBO_1436g0003 [Nosema bombycis CQ1]